MNLPSLGCDYCKLTSTKGNGTAESFKQFPIRAGDHILADRGYATAYGIQHVARANGYLTVRVNTGALRYLTELDKPFDLLAAVESLERIGAVGVWTAKVQADPPVPGRLCVLRKTEEAAKKARHTIYKTASRKGKPPWRKRYALRAT